MLPLEGLPFRAVHGEKLIEDINMYSGRVACSCDAEGREMVATFGHLVKVAQHIFAGS